MQSGPILRTTLGLVLGTATLSQAAFTATAGAVYDSTSNANAVDFDAAATGTTPATSVIGVTAFTAAVAAANLAGQGGVLDFDSVATNSSGTITANYGTVLTPKTLTISSTTSSSYVTSNNTGRTPISGTIYLNKLTGGVTPNDYGFGFGTITGATVLEGVTSVGLTFLSRDPGTTSAGNFGTVTGTATFSDGTTATSARSVTEAAGLGDTFYGFVAPAGLSITSVTLDVPGTTLFGGVDDVAFVTTPGVPEPTALAVTAGCGLMALRRRRVAR